MSAEIASLLSELIETTCASAEIVDGLLTLPGASEISSYQEAAIKASQLAMRHAYATLKAARAEFS